MAVCDNAKHQTQNTLVKVCFADFYEIINING